MSDFTLTALNKLFSVDGIITVHYFEFGKNYIFGGEKHDFWEFVYIDKGEAYILADDTWKSIGYGNIVFHRPMQFHNIKANGITAPNAAIITFSCKSEYMSFFDNLTTRLTEEEKGLIAKMISLAKKAFHTPLDDPFTQCLTKSGDTASEQLLGLYLEELLLLIYTRMNGSTITQPVPEVRRSTVSEAISYMNEHISSSLCILDIAEALMKSESELKRAFRRETGIGVMTYFRNMKINHAKQLLRQGDMNITEISQALGYNGIHHFSKQFKAITGMSPSEYSKSIKRRLDDNIMLKNPERF